MGLFVKLLTEITKLFYLNVKGLEKIWGNPETIAAKIQSDIQRDFGLPCTVGIGPNMLMAKLALDLESKKAPNGIAKWTYEDIPKTVWPISPLSKMWRISRHVEKTLNSMGFLMLVSS